MASFAYCYSHWPCYSDPELIPSMAQSYIVAEKPNRPPNATWNTSECSVASLASPSFLGYPSLFSIYFHIKTGQRQGKWEVKWAQFIYMHVCILISNYAL